MRASHQTMILGATKFRTPSALAAAVILIAGSFATGCYRDAAHATNAELEQQRSGQRSASDSQQQTQSSSSTSSSAASSSTGTSGDSTTSTQSSQTGTSQSGTTQTEQRTSDQSPSNAQQTASAGDSQRSGSRSPSERRGLQYITPAYDDAELADWYRPFFEDGRSTAMIRRSTMADPELEGVDHQDHFTTNCEVNRIDGAEGLIVARISCDIDQGDFMQGYYVAAREGVWLLNRLPRSAGALDAMIEEGRVFEIPLFPHRPREGSRALSTDSGNALFALEPSDSGGWCRNFSLPGATSTYDYRFCLNNRGTLEKAAYQKSREGKAEETVRYERWDGGLR